MRRFRWVWTAAVTAASLVAVGSSLTGCGRGSQPSAGPPKIEVAVTDNGFVPAVATVGKGRPVTLVITRKTDETCATEAVFASLDKRYDLPLNQPVRIEFPSGVTDTLRYACGMDMYKGMIVPR